MNEKIKKKNWLKILSFIYLLILIIFIGIIPINYNYSFSLGWIAGGFSSLITYSTIYFVYRKKQKNKLKFYKSIFRSILNILFQSILFFSIIVINHLANGTNILEKGLSGVVAPINLFTYIGGMSFSMLIVFTIFWKWY